MTNNGGLTKKDIEKAAEPIVSSTLALQRERDEAIAKYNMLFELNKGLQTELAAEKAKTESLGDMLRLTEERRALGDQEYRNQLATYTADRIAEQQAHASEMIQIKVRMQELTDQLNSVITACLNVVKDRSTEVPDDRGRP